MALNVPGLIATITFYLLVLGIGIWASIKSKRDGSRVRANHAEMALLGNRDISLWMGIFTTTGHYLGGRDVHHRHSGDGLRSKAGAHLGRDASVGNGGFHCWRSFLRRAMRDRQYVTMMDPFQLI
ncbi:hypothetical protein KUCAC02_022241 [Chaenocephalus aceratus]|nr:hypothetical protein KUCAC02_022241 [Chaenocephalus aceratus]